MARPSSSRGKAMKSGNDSSPPTLRRAPSSNRDRSGRLDTIAAIAPPTMNKVVSASPAHPQTTLRSAPASRVTRSDTGPSTTLSG